MAVVQARISPDVAAEVLASGRALEGLRRFVEQQVGQPATLEVRYWLHRSGTAQCIVAGAYVVNIAPDRITVQSRTAGRMALQSLTGAIEAQAGRLAVALATERAVDTLRARFIVTSDQVLPNGARVIRVLA